MGVSIKVVLVSLLVLVVISDCDGAKKRGLSPSFYRKSCPKFEKIVRDITYSKVAANRTLAAKLLRLHYHDCFVQGCDASLLLDSTPGNTAEKEARPNLSLSGYEVIDEIKAKLEKECPGAVSCADILAVTARDAVSQQFGKPMWNVPTGRKDGKVSLATEATRDLPSGGSNFTTLKTLFAGLGLDTVDLVALSGAHTIGEARCVVIARRLNFTGNGDIDPSLNEEYAEFLKTQCPVDRPNAATKLELDANSSLRFDSSYFVRLRQHKGLLTSDAALLNDGRAAQVARRFQKFGTFMTGFGKSMQKMGAIQIKTGRRDGEIRKNCRVVNARLM